MTLPDALIEQAPPATMTLRWCPECGRTDRWTTLGRTKHGAGGEWCRGTPVELTYVLEAAVRGAICNAAAEYAGKGDPANILLSTAMFQALAAVDSVIPEST